MGNNQGVDWLGDVEDVFKRYGRARDLQQHAASKWPAVKELELHKIAPATAIRRVLREAIAALEDEHPREAAVLRSRYMRNRSVEMIAAEHHVDPSTIHRLRINALNEVALVLAEHNRLAERRVAAQRFAPQHPVFGLDALVAQLVAHLHDAEAPPVIVVEGMGGLGKTTVARLIARQIMLDDTFVGVIWACAKQVDFDVWAGMRRVVQERAINPDDIVQQLAQDLGIAMHGDMAMLRADVIAHCKRAPYVIVLDNLETVADMAALAPLIGALVGLSRVVITTRDRAPHALPADVTRRYVPLSELDAPTSFAILRSIADINGAAGLQQASDADLQCIYDVTGGNPLALRLVAGQAHGVPWQEFIADLTTHSPRGSKGYELYDYLYRRSWEQLSEDARLVLFAMHRCETGAEYRLLHLLSGLDHDSFRYAVDELRQRMLLTFDGRLYGIHRLTYTFLRVGVLGWWQEEKDEG